MLAIGLIAACSGATKIDDTTCPPQGTAHTYENFGRVFFARHCTSCHGGPNGYSSRAFSSAEAIRSARDRIFINAADENASMPPGPDGPTPEERAALGEWLVCGAP
jgi:mono/diheme cytochrome c family protein